jgi:hypothetical protein
MVFSFSFLLLLLLPFLRQAGIYICVCLCVFCSAEKHGMEWGMFCIIAERERGREGLYDDTERKREDSYMCVYVCLWE